jgi:3-deoxy-D-manno-octulosonic-acid transferase
METELWPNFLRECKAQNVPVALVNGRISRQSFRRYRLVKFFSRTFFRNSIGQLCSLQTMLGESSALGLPEASCTRRET